MADEELERRLRAADPEITPAGDGLSLRAELDLLRIVEGHRTPSRRVPIRWVAVPALAFLAVLVTIAVQAFVTMPGTPAQAATPALLHGSGDALDISMVVKEAKAALESTSTEAQRGSKYEAWFVNTEVDGEGKHTSVIAPQETTITWNPDLTGEIVVVAGTPFDAVGSVVDAPNSPDPGTLIETTKFGPDEEAGLIGISFPDAPPTDVASMAEYLKTGSARDTSDPVQSVDSIGDLLNEWKLGSLQTAAALGVLERTDLTPLGKVQDRLGRSGYAFEAVSPVDKWKSVIVISDTTGAILTIEKVYLGGIPDFDVKPPAVTSYIAWK